MEHEGKVPENPTLTDQQVETSRRVVSELEAWKGWKRSRGGPLQTLWEHREVTILGGTGTSCPSGRIPWDKILAEEPEPEPVKEESYDMKTHYAWSQWHEGLEVIGSDTLYLANLRKDFSLPIEAKSVLMQPTFKRGGAEFFHADSEVLALKINDGVLVLLDENGSCTWRTLGTKMQFNRLQCLGYYL